MPTETTLRRAAERRRLAEARVKLLEQRDPATLTPEEVERLIHELRVHQIELEMQNEELIRTQVELEGVRARYFDLYHLAPVGYLTLSEKGLILEANLRAAALLGLPSKTLVKRPLRRFILAADSDVYYRHIRQLWQTGQPQACEVRLDPRRKGESSAWVRLEMGLAQDEKERATVGRVICRDVSERKRAELALREREERQKLILDHLSVGVVFADVAGTAFYVNPRFTELFGYTLADFPTLANWWPLAHPEPAYREQVVAEWNRRLAEALAGAGEIRPLEVMITCADGAEKYVRVTARAIGELLFVTFIDLTERKAADDALRASESHYRDLYENAPVAYFSVGTDGCIRRCNRQAAQLLGITIEQTVGRPVFELYPDNPHGKAKARQVFQHFLAGEPVVNQELQMLRADGTPVWIDLSVTAVRNAAGQVIESRSAVLDITERKRAEEGLRDSEERYRTLLMLSPDGVSVTDQTGRILTCNEQFAHMYGFEHTAEVIGRNAQEFARPEAFAGLYREVAAALARGENVVREVEVEVLRRDGSPLPAEYSIAPVPWPDAPFGVAYLSSIRDITKRKALAVELAPHQAHLEELVQARTRDLEAEIAVRTAAQATLERSQARLAEAERIAHLGSWELDLATGEYQASDEMRRIAGFGSEAGPFTLADVNQRIHLDDLAAVQAARQRTVQSEQSQSFQYRIVLPGGETRVLRAQAETRRDATGRPTRLIGVTQDITEQAAAQAALERSRASLAAAERIAHIGSWDRDLITGELHVSDGLYRILGFDPGMAPQDLYAAAWERVHPEDSAKARAAIERAQAAGTPLDVTFRIAGLSGETTVFHMIAEFERDTTGRLVLMQAMAQDITEQEQTRAALALRIQELSSMQDLGQVVSMARPLGELIDIYLHRLVRLAGLDFAQVYLLREGRLHLAGASSTQPSSAAPVRCLSIGECLCGLAVQDGKPVYAADVESDPRVTLKHCHANGLHSLAALPLRSGETPIGALAVAAVAPDAFADRLPFLQTIADLIAVRLQNALLLQEVRERAAGLEEIVAERTRELQMERDRTHAILETVGESVIVTGLDGQILFLNPATSTLTGRARDDELGQLLWRDWTHEVRAEIWPQAQAALRAGQAWHGEISGLRRDGTGYIAAVTGTPLYDAEAGAQPIGVVWVQRDVTAQKEAERLKDQFASNVTHELRTPISIIALACDNLVSFHDRLEGSQRLEIARDIQEQARLLDTIVESTLQMAQIDAGRVPMDRRRLDLARLVREEADQLRPFIGRRGQHLTISAAAAVEVLGNEMQLRQIVRNLLENAMKYSPADRRITCACEIRADAPGLISGSAPATTQAWAVVEVRDQGVGIAARDLPYLFERFYRVNGEAQMPGTGLGLPIAQQLASLHGGRITVASALGQGSTFTVYLPLAGVE